MHDKFTPRAFSTSNTILLRVVEPFTRVILKCAISKSAVFAIKFLKIHAVVAISRVPKGCISAD